MFSILSHFIEGFGINSSKLPRYLVKFYKLSNSGYNNNRFKNRALNNSHFFKIFCFYAIIENRFKHSAKIFKCLF